MEINTAEFNALVALKASEGYGIFIRLVDEQINMKLGSMLAAAPKDDNLNSAIINNMRGLGKARSIISSTIQEEEHKHDN